MTPNNDRELVVTRIFNARRELVFKMFTDPVHVTKWWAPQGWTTIVKVMDVRPGGIWHYCLKSDDNGQESWGKAIYREIVVPERLVFMDYFADAEGNPVEGMPEILMTAEFEEHEGKTKLTFIALFATAAERQTVADMGMTQGIKETLDKLEAALAAA